MSIRLLCVALVALLSTGCPAAGGSCAAPDQLFPNPRARASALQADGGLQVEVSWNVSASTPESFYAAPTAADLTASTSSVPAHVLDAGRTSATVAYAISESDAGTLAFELRYREGPVRTCSHGGMDDTYVLTVTAPFLLDGGVPAAGRVASSVELGAF